jgi:hypothetical protein
MLIGILGKSCNITCIKILNVGLFLVVYAVLACGHKTYVHKEEPKKKKTGKE